MKNFHAKHVVQILGIGLLILSVAYLVTQVQSFSFKDTEQYIRALGFWPVALALSLTILNYLSLTLYDFMALHHAKETLPGRKVLLASFVSFVFGNNLGFSGLSSSAVRFRLYSSWGLDHGQIARVILFNVLSFWIGFLISAGFAFAFAPEVLQALSLTAIIPFAPIGVVFLVIVAIYLALAFFKRRGLRILGRVLVFPHPSLALLQIFVSLLDWVLAAGVFFVLIPQNTGIQFMPFFAVYVAALALGFISNIPAGLGIFEAFMFAFLSPLCPGPTILNVIFLYRFIYLIIPLVIALAVFAIHEIMQVHELLTWMGSFFRKVSEDFMPLILAFLTAALGLVFFFTAPPQSAAGVLPGVGTLIAPELILLLNYLLSILGLCLLVLAPGLRYGEFPRFRLILIFVITGTIMAVVKGIEADEMVLVLLILMLLGLFRSRFVPPAAKKRVADAIPWVAIAIIGALSSIWLGFFSHDPVSHPANLLWQSDLSGQAPLFIRTLVIIALGGLLLGLLGAASRYVHTSRNKCQQASEIELARTILACQDHAFSNLALLGDKHFFFNSHKDAFVMYTVKGRRWIVYGDPVGPVDQVKDLVWEFTEACASHGAKPVFYEVARDNLGLYLELGLTVLKIGEEAHIDLGAFNMDGKERRRLRYYRNNLEKDGCTFQIIMPNEIAPCLPELKAVSDAWLSIKHVREKKFSLGFFDEEYLKCFPLAVIKKDGKITAFANVLTTESRREVGVDLMRYVPGQVDHVMELLFVKLLGWAKEEGYRTFNLGMAPFSGFRSRGQMPLWNRIMTLVFNHGEFIYNFQGLRNYKEQFLPCWQPKYIAMHGGFRIPKTLLDLSSVIGGGLKGVLRK